MFDKIKKIFNRPRQHLEDYIQKGEKYRLHLDSKGNLKTYFSCYFLIKNYGLDVCKNKLFFKLFCIASMS